MQEPSAVVRRNKGCRVGMEQRTGRVEAGFSTADHKGQKKGVTFRLQTTRDKKKVLLLDCRPQGKKKKVLLLDCRPQGTKKGVTSRMCVSSLRRGHANLLCIVPILI
jgi:hypothetical protein